MGCSSIISYSYCLQLPIVIWTMQLREHFPFVDGGELFYATLKYSYMASWRKPMKYKNFEATIFIIRKALPKFTKYSLMKKWSHTVQNLFKQNESFIFLHL